MNKSDSIKFSVNCFNNLAMINIMLPTKSVSCISSNINAVVKSRDILICNLLAKCWEIISLVDFLLVFYIVRKSGKSVTSYLLMNINELMLLPYILEPICYILGRPGT